MSGFADAYFRHRQQGGDPPSMGFLLAWRNTDIEFSCRAYAVCDHWFAPLPTDTQPNRSMAYSGYV